MRCPMAFCRDEEVYDDTCYKEDCCWWNNDSETCAILQLSKDLYRIEDYLGHIRRREI